MFVIDESIPNRKFTRAFEMENTPFGVQPEFYELETLTNDPSKINMQTTYRSVVRRDQMPELTFSLKPRT